MSAQHEHDPAEIATRTIYQEHINLWRIILLLDRLQRDIDERDEEPDEVLISSILDYFEQFSERVQSGPNEILLFERLRQRSAGSFAELDELERDYLTAHQALQGLRQQLHECVTNWPQGREQLSAALGEFTTHLRGHIQQEEQLLIPRARELLNPADWAEIAAAKDQYDDPLFGERVREEFRELRHHIINIAPEHVGGLGIQHKTRIEPQTHEQILTVSSLSTSYGRIQALYDVDLSIRSGEIVALVGANGAGKSTLLMTLSGLQPADSGTITYRHHDLTRMPAHRRVHEGIVQIPEGRQVFRDLSVHDNLLMGAYTRGRDAQVMTDLDNIYSRFPVLRQKQHQLAGMLSGGQQQMLAIGRALMAAPRLLLLDEPSMGLAPLVVEEIFNILRDLNREGITLFLVEQNASQALSIADRGYVLEAGKVVLSGSGEQLLADDKVREAYLGL
ncbi:ATP-binding cassette domain-containing protein [Halorhodospira halochloris]|nr:ATP-binding cassette domain-containing protein [Halorhodospira halochloris]MCG5549349.1 ATP-binding cassette domain-containing protein [Halorhodospira halochloris]